MDPARVSLSVRIAALVRAHHAMQDDPKIFHEHQAIRRFTTEERAQFSAYRAEGLKSLDPTRCVLP